MDPFLGEIKIFAGTFAPSGWAFCNGQILSIPQNTALFSLLGTTYGGDGKTTFGLPNLQGRAPLDAGQGPGLANRPLGSSGGQAAVTLTSNQMPAHTHTAAGYNASGDQNSPVGNVWAISRSGKSPQSMYSTNPGSGAQMNANILAPAGGNQPHNNMPPYLALNFIIALVGIYPTRD